VFHDPRQDLSRLSPSPRDVLNAHTRGPQIALLRAVGENT
jgi:hypothetical protein